MPEARHWIVLPSAGGQTLRIYYDLSSTALADQLVPNRSTNQHVVFDFEIFIPTKCPGIMKKCNIRPAVYHMCVRIIPDKFIYFQRSWRDTQHAAAVRNPRSHLKDGILHIYKRSSKASCKRKLFLRKASCEFSPG